jgi:hypothetical protein
MVRTGQPREPALQDGTPDAMSRRAAQFPLMIRAFAPVIRTRDYSLPSLNLAPVLAKDRSVHPDEEIRGHCDTHANHNAAHLLGISLLCVVRAEPASG